MCPDQRSLLTSKCVEYGACQDSGCWRRVEGEQGWRDCSRPTPARSGSFRRVGGRAGSEPCALPDLLTRDDVRLAAVVGVYLRRGRVAMADQVAADNVRHDFARVAVDFTRHGRAD